MGNEASNISSQQSKHDKEFIDKLQKQILQNQIQIQNIQLSNLQQNQNYNQYPPNLQNILNSPPNIRNQYLQQILDTQSHNLTLQQKNKIEDILARNNNNQNSLPPINNYGTKSYYPQQQHQQLQKQAQLNTIKQINASYNNEDERLKHEFELEQQRLKEKYQELQRKKKLEYQNKMAEIENKNFDALKLFQLNRNYTYNELKQAYKRLATRTHPDKGGSNEKFQMVTKCYFLLLEKLKNQESDKQYHQIKSESEKYRTTQDTTISPSSIKTAKEKFNLKMFNKIFEENKIYDANSEGYDNWLKNKDTPKQKQPELFSQKFNIDVFNNTFNNYKEQNPQNQIIEYKEPEALVSCNKLDHASIDNTRQGDFTKCVEKNDELAYSDLKTAYTNGNLINPNQVAYKTYKNVDELERARSNISFQMSEEDLAKQEMLKRIEAQQEEERIRRINQRDNLISDNYNSVHQRMLGFNGSVPSR